MVSCILPMLRAHRAACLLLIGVSAGCSHDWDFYERDRSSAGAGGVGSGGSGAQGGAGAQGGSGAGAGGVTVDNASSKHSGSGAVAALTQPHAVAGQDRLLWVGVAILDDSGASVDTVTYGDVGLTFAGRSSLPGQARVEAWYLVAPATGESDIVVTPTTGATMAMGAISFVGVDPDEPLGELATANGSGEEAVIDVVDVPAGAVVVDALAKPRKSNVPTCGSGQEQQWNLATTAGNDGKNITGAGSTKPASESTSLSWSFATSQQWVMVALAVRPK